MHDLNKLNSSYFPSTLYLHKDSSKLNAKMASSNQIIKKYFIILSRRNVVIGIGDM